MAIRVLIEREIESDHEAELVKTLLQLRAHAMQEKGYISGETLRSRENPEKFIVISTWNSVDDWKAWEANSDRKRIQEGFRQFLRGAEKASVYEYL